MLVLKRPNTASVTTINQDGSRFFLHPSDVSGRFTLWRRITGFILLAIYVLLPWIPIGGHPAVFFDLAARRFHFFGMTFVTQDLWLAFFLLTGLGFGLFYVTSLFGRLWCGWTCPYTVFLEHLYRRVERLIDGDAGARRKLDAAPWTGTKIAKRVIKHGIYLLISAIIAHVFLSYFVSIPRLYEYMKQSPLANAKAFGVVAFLTACLYFAFSWFREQFCIILCPYGRIQSALTDDNTMVVGYDEKRGEPRGKASDSSKGDCVDCLRCVQVCPTGIDIRNGLQMECIGCASCIDACDTIMTKLKRPKGLIRYDSLNGLAGSKTKYVRPRTILYSVLMLFGAAVLFAFLSQLHSADASISRMAGEPFYVTEDTVRNQYELQLVTKRDVPTTFTITVEDAPPELLVSGFDEPVVLKPLQESSVTFFLQMPIDHYKGGFSANLNIHVEPGDIDLKKELEFLGPSSYIFADRKQAAEGEKPGVTPATAPAE